MPKFDDYEPFLKAWGIVTAKPINLNAITNPSPQDGDLWSDGVNLYFRINGQNFQLAAAGNPANSINYTEEFFLMGA